MNVSLSDAKAQLLELVRRAEAGDEVVLTRHGQPTVRLVPVAKRRANKAELKALFDALQESARKNMTPGPCAARSQDFLYDDDGLPG